MNNVRCGGIPVNSESHDRIRVLLILVPIKSSVYLTDDPVQGCVFATSRIISLLRHEKKALILPSTKKLTVCIEKKTFRKLVRDCLPLLPNDLRLVQVH